MRLARQELPTYLEQVLAKGNEKHFRDFQMDLEDSQFLEEKFPEENFRLLLTGIKNPQFLQSENAWSLLFIFEDDWEKLTPFQQSELLDALREAYERADNWMICFSISELVGEQFPADQAFEFFNQFTNSTNRNAKLFAPHGLEHALRNSTDEELTKRLWNILLQMETDEDENVRAEVRQSLLHLAYHGLQKP